MIEPLAIGLFAVTLLITIFGSIALRRLWGTAFFVAVLASSIGHASLTSVVLSALYFGAWDLGYLIAARRAGQLLLHLEKQRTRRQIYFYRIYALALAAVMLFAILRVDISFIYPLGAILVVLAALLVMLIIIRPNIRTRGILSNGDFIKWNSIKSYEWRGNALVINVRVPLTAFWRVRVPVASTNKEAVEHLLAEKIPGKKVYPGLAD